MKITARPSATSCASVANSDSLSCGVSTLRFMPPLNVSAGEIDEAIEILRLSLDEALAGLGAAAEDLP